MSACGEVNLVGIIVVALSQALGYHCYIALVINTNQKLGKPEQDAAQETSSCHTRPKLLSFL